MVISKKYDGDEVSSIADKGEIGFIDYDNDKSVCSYNPEAEGPIIISIPFPFVNKKPQSVLLGDIVNDKITIENTTESPVDLWKVEIYDSNPKESFTVSLMEPPSEKSDEEYVRGFFESFGLEDRVLQPNQTLSVWLSCKPKGTGLHTTAVHFEVGDHVIERLVFLLVDDKVSRSLVSSKPYFRDRKKKQLVVDASDVHTYIPTARPARQVNRGRNYHLNSYPIPKEVREAVKKHMVPSGLADGLVKENYCNYFHTLLNMEEITMEEEMRGYDMECISFGRKGPYLTLEVPGLAEKRPSLVVGDFIFAKLAFDAANDRTQPYQGYIHRVEAEKVYLQFDKDFHFYHASPNLYNVQFNYNRINMRKKYRAIEATDQLDTDFLFPSDSAYRRRIKPTQLGPFSNMLNEEQKLSIKMIIGCRGGPPYIIHGPPGTGKTVTIVEAVIQLYRGRKDTRLLVCAPSNNAADNILEILLEKLGKIGRRCDLLRLNAATRSIDDIKPEYQQFCYFEESSFTCPPLRELCRFRIIISTYMSSYSLYAEGIKQRHFSHIFLDEAGQASEPETMIPLSQLCTRETVVVLAGDPCQLGPVIHSKGAESCGLSMSFLARLFDCEFYESGNENYVTKLVRNYRCHPEILFLPSQLFYNEELIALRTEDPSSENWADLLPDKEFPVLFMGVQGCDEREGNNPSWFNRIEVSKVVETVKKLTERRLNEEDIGVITPYRQQVIKVTNILESLGFLGIKVGSVEQFQGQEKKVIIVSTVRSTIKHNEFDKIHYLGFLSNWRRFNVAITRARSLLIIIGNPHIIGKDKYWNLLLWRCVEKGSYEGCALPEKESSPEEYPLQEGNWDYEDQENNTWWGDMPLEKNIAQGSNGDGWDDWSNDVNIPQSSNGNRWGDSSHDEPNPQGSDDGGCGEGQTKVIDNDVPWE